MKIHPKFLLLSLFITSVLSLCHSVTSAQLVPDFRVNEDPTNEFQGQGSMGCDTSGNFVVAWRDSRGPRTDIYCQRFDSNANRLGNNFKVNINPDSSMLPGVAVASDGSFGVCWIEALDPDVKAKLMLFSNSSLPITSEIVLNEVSIWPTSLTLPSITVNKYKQYTVVWQHDRGIMFQRIDSNGNRIGQNVRVITDTTLRYSESPKICTVGEGGFVITWEAVHYPQIGFPDVYFQRFDRYANRLGTNTKVNDDNLPEADQRFPQIDGNSEGKFVIAWSDRRLGESEPYYQRFDTAGLPIGPNNNVCAVVTFNRGLGAVMMREDGQFLIGGEEFWPPYAPYFQKFSATGWRINDPYKVTTQSPSAVKYARSFKNFNDKLICVWDDTRNGEFDVYGKILSYSNPDTTVSIHHLSLLVPDRFILEQNYPNPFNSSTTIRFSVRYSGMYSLKVYNSTGQKLSDLFSRKFIPGSYQITFSSYELASGVYFYELSSSDERSFKKFVVLK